jgi:hypothetical protein
MKPECPISTPIAPPSKNTSAKGVRLQRRTSGRPVPIEIERLSAGGGGQPHAFETRVAAAVRANDRGSGRHIFDLRHEAAGADDPPAMQIFHGERRGDLVMPRRNIERLVLPDVGGTVRRVGWPEAMIERGLQRGGVVGREIADGAEATVLYAHRLEVGKQQHWRPHGHAAVVRAVHVVPPSVLM